MASKTVKVRLPDDSNDLCGSCSAYGSGRRTRATWKLVRGAYYSAPRCDHHARAYPEYVPPPSTSGDSSR